MEGDGFFSRLREWINEGAGRWVTIVAALAVIGGAAALAYRGRKRSEVEAVLEHGRRVLFVCTNPECGERGEMRVPYYCSWPRACPKCKQKTAVPGFRCQWCGEIIKTQAKPMVRCPHCGYVHDFTGGPVSNPFPPKSRFREE